MVTLADRWKAEGKAVGRAEGKAETLILLLNRKFGTIPEARLEQIGSARLEDLNFWIEAVLVSQSIDGVFDKAQTP